MTTRANMKAATRARVKAAAKERFAAVGYDRATMRDIAKTAGLSTGAAYSAWDGKEDLWEDVMGRRSPSGISLAYAVLGCVDDADGARRLAAEFIEDFAGPDRRVAPIA